MPRKVLKGTKVKTFMQEHEAKVFEGTEVQNEPSKIEDQRKKFGSYLREKVKQAPDNTFFRDMLSKLDSGDELTPNMEAAVERCQKQDEQRKNGEPIKVMSLRLKPWFAQQMEIKSLVITGNVMVETPKAYLMKGHADLVEAVFCNRCGRHLTEVASQVIGVGATCAEHWGVPYPAEILSASKKERQKIQKNIRTILRDHRFERWIPKSQVKEVLVDKPYKK